MNRKTGKSPVRRSIAEELVDERLYSTRVVRACLDFHEAPDDPDAATQLARRAGMSKRKFMAATNALLSAGEPLSFFPEELRLKIARKRVERQLLNVIHTMREGQTLKSPHAPNIVQALLHMFRDEDKANDTLEQIERATTAYMAVHHADERTLVPVRHTHGPTRNRASYAKRRLLSVVHDALEANTLPQERATDSKLDKERLIDALSQGSIEDSQSTNPIMRDLRVRARAIGIQVFAVLDDEDLLAADLGFLSPLKLGPVIGVVEALLTEGEADTPTVARAIAFALGVPWEDLHNYFGSRLVFAWKKDRQRAQ